MAELGPLLPDISVSAFVRGLIEEGIGVAEGRDLMRSYGMRMSNQAFSNLYGDVRSIIANRDQLQGLDYNALPSGDVYRPWAAGTPNEYATFVHVQYRLPGSDEVQTVFRTYVTSDPHTPSEAEQYAIAEVENLSGTTGSFAGATVYGATISSMTRTVQR